MTMKIEPDLPDEARKAAVRAMRDEEMGLAKLRPIKGAPPRNAPYLFWSPGDPHANNPNAQKPYFKVDEFNDRWPRGHHQFPEAPYTHWMPLPPTPEIY